MRDRVVSSEMMDDPAQDGRELARSLVDLQGVNRWLGGRATVLRRLGPLILRAAPHQRTIRLLDVGTGSADLPLFLVRWSRRRGVRLRAVATDLHPETLRLARRATAGEPSVRIRCADALELPFASGSFDFAMCCTALHHFVDDEAVRVLRELDRVATRGVLVSDLRRSGPALLGARLLAATLWRRHPMTRHDGPASVAAAFTPAELEALAARAGLRGARVRAEPVFRLSLLSTREPLP